MAVNKKIVTDVLNYIGAEAKSGWYVGIATNAKNRLFQNHKVDEKNGYWIYH